MTKDTTIVFYDATCVLCDRSILWLIKNDLKDGFVSQHYLDNNERSYNNFSECKVVSLDEFNKSYELIKN